MLNHKCYAYGLALIYRFATHKNNCLQSLRRSIYLIMPDGSSSFCEKWVKMGI